MDAEFPLGGGLEKVTTDGPIASWNKTQRIYMKVIT